MLMMSVHRGSGVAMDAAQCIIGVDAVCVCAGEDDDEEDDGMYGDDDSR